MKKKNLFNYKKIEYKTNFSGSLRDQEEKRYYAWKTIKVEEIQVILLSRTMSCVRLQEKIQELIPGIWNPRKTPMAAILTAR